MIQDSLSAVHAEQRAAAAAAAAAAAVSGAGTAPPGGQPTGGGQRGGGSGATSGPQRKHIRTFRIAFIEYFYDNNQLC